MAGCNLWTYTQIRQNSDIYKFDAQFFGVNAKQVEGMDCRIRILLEKTYEAILDSGMPSYLI